MITASFWPVFDPLAVFMFVLTVVSDEGVMVFETENVVVVGV